MKGSILIVLGVALAVVSSFDGVEGSAGVKDYGDSCNILASGVQFFETLANGKNQYQGACDVAKGLICAINVCKCGIGEYKQTIAEQIFGGGKCSGSTKVSVGFGAIVVFIPILHFFRN